MVDVRKAMEVMNRIGRPPEFSFTPSETVLAAGKSRLLRYFPKDSVVGRTPILLVPSLINKYYILDLLPSKSYVEFLVAQGFAVYLLDWGVPDDSDRFVSLEDHLDSYLRDAVGEICRREDVSDVSLVGYCMGGTMSLMFAALYPEIVRNLVLLATPVDFENDSLLSVWSRESYFDVDRLVDTYGNIPVSVMQSVFQLLKPVKTFTRYVDLYENAENEAFVETFLAFDYWANDQIPVAGETFRVFAKDAIQKNLLVKNGMQIGGRNLDLRRIKSPILSVIAEHDNIVPSASAAAIEDKTGSSDVELLSVKGGHHGITIGSSAQSIVWRKTADWIG